MNISDTPRLRAETVDALSRARRLLDSLEEAKAETDRHLARLRRADAYASVTGRSSLENACASTRRLIESLERAADRLTSYEVEVPASAGAYALSR